MKNQLIALAVTVLLAACGDKPRGPLEVQGKTFMDREFPVQFEFSSRDKGRLWNISTDRSLDFQYTLEDKKLVIEYTQPNSKEVTKEVLELGDSRYSGGVLDLAELKPEDQKRVEKIKEETRQAKEREAKLSPKGAPSDTKAYTSIDTIGDESNDWGGWLAAAWNAEKTSDDTLLQYFSRKWSSTEDSFARQEMRASELARIKQRLAEVRKIEYLHLPHAQKFVPTRLQVDKQAYDFDKKSFHILGSACGLGLAEQTRSGVTVSMTKNPDFCWLPVPDPEVARKVEAARIAGGVVIDGDFYAKLVYIDASNDMTLVPVGAQLQVLKQTYSPAKPEDLLAEVSLWSKQ